ncbi:type II toxin-antitoxin system Phd/YefM family antitoxin [Candidatus Poribacteria bacterium]|nr:type II toxin-antitoxin system Phd/YefM family antitoxin [Candidatus Poribacteria bacterium]
MKRVKVSELKTECYSILKKVEKTKEPILITRKGKPVAKIVPTSIDDKKSWLGCMASTGKIVGDITSPILDEWEWEVLKKESNHD